MRNQTSYENAGSIENESIGVKLLVSIDGPLTEEERRIASRAIEAVYQGIIRERAKNNPQGQESRRAWIVDLLGCFPESTRIYHEEIPNGYCSSSCCVNRPWLIVTTPAGRITIGSRKRVIQISWDGSKIMASASHLFPDEDTTKEGCLIHAWGLDKAREYIAVLLASGEEMAT